MSTCTHSEAWAGCWQAGCVRAVREAVGGLTVCMWRHPLRNPPCERGFGELWLSAVHTSADCLRLGCWLISPCCAAISSRRTLS
jgi:hypothetical protein